MIIVIDKEVASKVANGALALYHRVLGATVIVCVAALLLMVVGMVTLP